MAEGKFTWQRMKCELHFQGELEELTASGSGALPAVRDRPVSATAAAASSSRLVAGPIRGAFGKRVAHATQKRLGVNWITSSAFRHKPLRAIDNHPLHSVTAVKATVRSRPGMSFAGAPLCKLLFLYFFHEKVFLIPVFHDSLLGSKPFAFPSCHLSVWWVITESGPLVCSHPVKCYAG